MGEDFMRKLRERTAHISFAGMTFCLAGKFPMPKEGTYMSIRGYGGKTTESVSKNTTYLVVPDGEIDEENANVKKARQLGVKIIDRTELTKMMGLDDENLRDL
jgi:DNA ligase (NAD+)